MQADTVYNFYAGPATLPRTVMEKAQSEFVNYDGIGFSVVETSHRSEAFQKVVDHTETNIRKLMGIGEDYAVLFLQGGASLQFAMLPMNLAVDGKPFVYADTGRWTAKAIAEAKLFGDVELMYDGSDSEFKRIGDPTEWDVPENAAYAYICSNNTINGTQYHFFPETGEVPLIADMSSDIMSRPIDVSKFGAIFAGAQKNIGPAGVTLVIIRRDLAERVSDRVPTLLKYSTQIEKGSLFNTPPSFSIYMVGLVTDWILEKGGVQGIAEINASKSQALYEYIDMSIFYQGTAESGDRSKMNICFRLPEEALEEKFVEEATEVGLVGLKGHRSVGGIRASLYNAMPMAGVSALLDFMADFEEKHG